MNRAELDNLLVTLRHCNRALALLGDPPMTGEQMLERFPGLRALEEQMPGLVEVIMRAGNGDQAAEHKLQAIVEAGQDAAPGVH